MSNIKVYFVDNHTLIADRDKVSFKDKSGEFFTLSDGFKEEDQYSRLIDDGRVLVNWDNVCFVVDIGDETKKEPYEE